MDLDICIRKINFQYVSVAKVVSIYFDPFLNSHVPHCTRKAIRFCLKSFVFGETSNNMCEIINTISLSLSLVSIEIQIDSSMFHYFSCFRFIWRQLRSASHSYFKEFISRLILTKYCLWISCNNFINPKSCTTCFRFFLHVSFSVTWLWVAQCNTSNISKTISKSSTYRYQIISSLTFL